MRIPLALIVVLAFAVPIRAATTFPASTNANQTFFGANSFSFPITLLSSTASTIQKVDGSKATSSIANGTGALTNDSLGNFGWFVGFLSTVDLNATSNAILSQFTNTINSTSNSILSQMTNGLNSTSNSLLTQIGTAVNTYSNNVNTLINATSNNIISQVATNTPQYGTNALATADFSQGHEYGWTNTSTAVTFPAPIHLPSPLNKAPTCVVMVTNSSGSPVALTAPANCHVVPGSVAFVTNVTACTFHLYGNAMTNVYFVPLY